MIHQNRVFVACPARSNFALSLLTDHCRLTCLQRRFLYIQLDASLNDFRTARGCMLSNYFLQSISVRDRADF